MADNDFRLGGVDRRVRNLELIHPHATAPFQLVGAATADGTSQFLEVTSIPQTHVDLLVMLNGASGAATASSNVGVRFNGDSGNNYRGNRIRTLDNGVPTTVSSQSANQIFVGSFPENVLQGSMHMDIPNYSLTGATHVVTFRTGMTTGSAAGGSEFNTGAGQYVVGTNHTITQLAARIGPDNWASGSTLRVYGLGVL